MATRRMTRRSFRTGARRRRNYQWARLTEHGTDVNITTAGIPFDLLSEYRTDAGLNMGVLGATIQRIHLSFGAYVSATTATQIRALGVGIIKTSGLGGAEVPRPFDDQHANWMWWETYFFEDVLNTVRTVDGKDRSIDVRAQRRLDELEDQLWLVLQADITGFNVQFSASTLMLLGNR